MAKKKTKSTDANSKKNTAKKTAGGKKIAGNKKGDSRSDAGAAMINAFLGGAATTPIALLYIADGLYHYAGSCCIPPNAPAHSSEIVSGTPLTTYSCDNNSPYPVPEVDELPMPPLFGAKRVFLRLPETVWVAENGPGREKTNWMNVRSDLQRGNFSFVAAACASDETERFVKTNKGLVFEAYGLSYQCGECRPTQVDANYLRFVKSEAVCPTKSIVVYDVRVTNSLAYIVLQDEFGQQGQFVAMVNSGR